MILVTTREGVLVEMLRDAVHVQRSTELAEADSRKKRIVVVTAVGLGLGQLGLSGEGKKREVENIPIDSQKENIAIYPVRVLSP